MKIEVGKTYEATSNNGFRNKGERIKIKSISANKVRIESKDGKEIVTTQNILKTSHLKLVDEKSVTDTKPAHYDTEIDTLAFAKANFSREQVEGFMRINAIKYLQRVKKGQVLEDLKKSRSYIDMLIEMEEEK